MTYTKRSAPYAVGQKEPYKLSRSKLEMFSQCQRCFWLDNRLKISRPSSPPFKINSLIDELYKREFDELRKKGEAHPIMIKHKLKAVPFAHPDLDNWRNTFVGIQSLHHPTNLIIYGAVDDVWINDQDELIVVDYKATAKNGEVNLDADWQKSYKRQLEIYQWLFKQNGFKVSSVGYFVYTNADHAKKSFEDSLDFKTKLISHEGSTDWVEDLILAAKECLEGDIPNVGKSIMGGECEYCAYARVRTELSLKYLQNLKKQKA